MKIQQQNTPFPKRAQFRYAPYETLFLSQSSFCPTWCLPWNREFLPISASMHRSVGIYHPWWYEWAKWVNTFFSSHRTCCFRLERIKPNFFLLVLSQSWRGDVWEGRGGDFGRAKKSSLQESTFSNLSLKQSSERTARARRCPLILENLSLLLENIGLVDLVWC